MLKLRQMTLTLGTQNYAGSKLVREMSEKVNESDDQKIIKKEKKTGDDAFTRAKSLLAKVNILF